MFKNYEKRICEFVVDSLICGKTTIDVKESELDPESDIYVFAVDKLVSVTPLSVDLTSRVNLSIVQELLENKS